MKVLIVHQVISLRDAIGHDIDGMYMALKENGVLCYCFGEIVTNPALQTLSQCELESFLTSPDNILFYHHSIFWANGHKILRKAKCRVFIKYHNITPPSFFRPYSLIDAKKCYLGNKQTEKIQSLVPEARWICDSEFNLSDLSVEAQKSAAVVPPFHKIDTLRYSKPNYFYLEKLIHSNSVNILFVGRVAPNKGHFFLLNVLFEVMQQGFQNVHLHIIGSYYEESSYLKSFIRYIHEKNLQSFVTHYGSLSLDSMLSFYLGCDFFMCASEHEGFCVPLLEAQVLSLPVSARPLSGVLETLGTDFSGFAGTPSFMATQLLHFWNDRKAYKSLIDEGATNFNSRFSSDEIKRRCLSVIIG